MLHLGGPQSFFSNIKVKPCVFLFQHNYKSHDSHDYVEAVVLYNVPFLNQPCSLLRTGTLMDGRSAWLCCSAISL